MTIFLNDILRFENLSNVKIRFNKSNGYANPIEFFKNNKEGREELMAWQFWNYNRNKSFKEGQIAAGFVHIDTHRWLLFDISRITKDLGKLNDVGYEYEPLKEYEKYFGRLVIEFKKDSRIW